MPAQLVTVDEMREYASIGTGTTDATIQAALDEAEAALVADVGVPSVGAIGIDPAASAIARGDEMRRAAHLLSRRNSPEGIAGAGDDGIITVPAVNPGSANSVQQIKMLLGLPLAVVA